MITEKDGVIFPASPHDAYRALVDGGIIPAGPYTKITLVCDVEKFYTDIQLEMKTKRRKRERRKQDCTKHVQDRIEANDGRA